mgnify:FL=1
MISIHRIVLRRMFAAWLLASLLIGSIAYFIEMEKVDDAVITKNTASVTTWWFRYWSRCRAKRADQPVFLRVFLSSTATSLRSFASSSGTPWAVLIAILATSLLLYPVIVSLNRDVLRFSHQVLRGNLEMASVLGAGIAKRDSYTGDHNFRVALYAIKLGEAVGLTPEEFALMRTHVALGVDIIDESEWLQGAREVIEGHHEKFDGSGYLRGLKGEQIPLNARIFAIVDVFDALTSRRPYKEPMPLVAALGIIQTDAGTHFDPKLVSIFQEIAAAMYANVDRRRQELKRPGP